MKYLALFFVFMGIWFAAALINGVLSGICLSVCCYGAYGNGTVGLCLLCSFFFSIPFVAVVWLVAVVAQLCGRRDAALFQVVLGTTVIVALAGALCFIGLFSRDFGDARFAVAASIVIAAVSAVLLFRPVIKGKHPAQQPAVAGGIILTEK